MTGIKTFFMSQLSEIMIFKHYSTLIDIFIEENKGDLNKEKLKEFIERIGRDLINRYTKTINEMMDIEKMNIEESDEY
jgi:ribosomal protein S17E